MPAARPPVSTANSSAPTSFRVPKKPYSTFSLANSHLQLRSDMKILVANLGSTSFKYRLFDMTDEKVLARGGVERIGSEQARAFVDVDGQREERTLAATDHAVAVRLCLEQLTANKYLANPRELAAIAFKAVHA